MKKVVSRTLSVHKEHELLLKLEDAGLDDDIAQKVIDSKNNELGKGVVDFIKNKGVIVLINKQLVPFDYSQVLEDWEEFYKKVFSLKTDFAGIPIPEADNKEFPWFICIPEGFTTEQAFSGGKFQFKTWKYTDKSLDEALNLNFGRDSLKGPYIVRCRANYEADEDLKNLSANQIAEKGINTLTLKERLLLGRFIYWKEKKLLDRKTITLCAGSRSSVGHVPCAFWDGDDDGLQVDWCILDDAFDGLRARREVSL